MAAGKLSPRQKMINLMYLVFIAMLALNMSKEVLSAFGLMNEKFESSNTASVASNTSMLAALDTKAAEAKGEFTVAAETAHKVEAASSEFYAYIETLKAQVLKGFEVDIRDFISHNSEFKLLDSIIRDRSEFKKSFELGLSVSEYSKDSKAAIEIKALIKEIQQWQR